MYDYVVNFIFPQIVCFYVNLRWTINTKYYTADVSMWMAHLFNEFSITGTPMLNQVAALVMVFDLNNVSIT
ncbi:putative alpha/gamma-adaptin-binding protein p34 [Helianthus annuus]|nr:putative alpha/gamma-adaptin-binding protein p34 [Helianthus annuus]KAJ0662326.1 putative alpha/gamma-adaptin-binding protein p34 [Helianthus annuus]